MKVEIVKATKSFGRTNALDDVSIVIKPGQIVSVLGLNGAGKTTLLNALTGLIALNKGMIRYDGEEFVRGRLDLRKRLGYLPDFPSFFEDWTIVRHLGLMLRIYDKRPADYESVIIELMRDFDLLPLYRKPLGELSRGQRYKAALATHLAVDPELWLFDEPFASGMDPHGINAFKRQCRKAAERGRTIIYTTQLLDIADRFSERACVLHQGVVRAFDSPSNLKRKDPTSENPLEDIFEKLKEDSAE